MEKPLKSKKNDIISRPGVTERFVESYYQLYARRIVASEKDFCQRINLNTSNFSQMKQGRINCSFETVLASIREYDINPTWLFTAAGTAF